MNPRSDSASPEESKPWWRHPMMWLVVGGPLVVVVASIVTAVIAHNVNDPVLARDPAEFSGAHPSATQPAIEGRNRAALDAMERARAAQAPADGG